MSWVIWNGRAVGVFVVGGLRCADLGETEGLKVRQV